MQFDLAKALGALAGEGHGDALAAQQGLGAAQIGGEAGRVFGEAVRIGAEDREAAAQGAQKFGCGTVPAVFDTGEGQRGFGNRIGLKGAWAARSRFSA